MIPSGNRSPVPWLPVLLAVIHVVLFVLTFSFQKTASGGNPFFCVDLPWTIALVAEGQSSRIPVVGILATAWWFFIGYVGWSSRWGRISRAGSIVSASLLPLICAFDSYAMLSQFGLIAHQPDFSSIDVVIYILAAALILGGFVSAIYAWVAALGFYGDS
jgi:hypothetical protein